MDTVLNIQDCDAIERMIHDHIIQEFSDEEKCYWLAQSLLRDGYLKISNIVPKSVKEMIANEAKELLASYAKRRDLHMESTGNTPRFMSNVKTDRYREVREGDSGSLSFTRAYRLRITDRHGKNYPQSMGIREVHRELPT